MPNKLRYVLKMGDYYRPGDQAVKDLDRYHRDYKRHFPPMPVFKSTRERVVWIFENLGQLVRGPRELWIFREPRHTSPAKSGWRQLLDAAGALGPRPKRKKKPQPQGVRNPVVLRAAYRYAPAATPPVEPAPEPAPVAVAGNHIRWDEVFDVGDHYYNNDEDLNP